MIDQTLNPQAFAIAAAPSLAAAATPLDDIDAVVAAHRPAVFRFLLVSLRDRDAAESLAQDTFLRAYNQRSHFRGECSLRTWLMRIAVNLARDHTRTGRFKFWRRAALDAIQADDIASRIAQPGASAESLLIAREQVGRVWTAVADLSPRQRSVFLLRFVEELELPEIALAAAMPVSTVKSHLYRAIAAVRAELSRPAKAKLEQLAQPKPATKEPK